MKKYIALAISALILFSASCKKKEDAVPGKMTFYLDKDSLWTTSNIVTDNSNAGVIYISATSPDGNESVDLALSGYNGGKKTFLVDYRGTGGNINGNTGAYRKGTETIMARAGKIVVTDVTNTLITGTFDLFYLQTNFKGTFSAPAKSQ